MSNIKHAPQGFSAEEALLHSDDYVSCLGRMAVSEAADKLVDLLNDELERGTEPAVLLITLARFQIQSHASLVAQLGGPKAAQSMSDHYARMIRETYLDHVEQTRGNMEQPL